MNTLTFETHPMNQLEHVTATTTDWLWNGYLARGRLTLITGMWKCGKSTLLTGLLQHMGTGEPFIGRECKAGQALVVSEEGREHWAARTRIMPVGANSRLVSRPFRHRPDAESWDGLVDQIAGLRETDGLDLLAIDSLATFLPGRAESDAGTWMTMLDPLRRLAEDGVAVLLLHHPRRRPSAEGCSARGTRALIDLVDINVELRRAGPIYTDDGRRRLIARSRFVETPTRLYYHWDQATGIFSPAADPFGEQFRTTWSLLHAALSSCRQAVTHHELLAHWPTAGKPSVRVLYEWLNRAVEEGLVRRSGSGRRNDPYRYGLGE